MFLITFTFWGYTGQMFFTMTLNMGVFDVFLMIRLSLLVLEEDITGNVPFLPSYQGHMLLKCLISDIIFDHLLG